MRYLPFLVAIGLVVYTVIDVVRSDDETRQGVHPALWVAFMVVLPVIGSLAWLAVRRPPRRRTARGPGIGRVPRAPVAPDDDPEFLWRLEEEQRRRAREGEGPVPPAGPPAPPTPPTGG